MAHPDSRRGQPRTEVHGQRRSLLRSLAIAVVGLAALFFAACGGSAESSGPTTVIIWHSMPSLAQGALQRIVDEFNTSQTQYKAELVYQGGYSDSLNKLISSLGRTSGVPFNVRIGDYRIVGSDQSSKTVPAIIQLDDVSTRIMVDSEQVVPIQEFIDKEGYDLSDYEPKAVEYYTIDGKLYAMPFNLSGPILYYDRAAFQEAGLDPDKPPVTLEEVRAYAEKLRRPAGNGLPARSGMALEVSAWTFEEMLAKSGAAYVNNGNGRSDRATEAVFAGPEGQAIIQWWHDMVSDGIAYNANDTVDAFLHMASGETAMLIASTGALRGAIAALTLAGKDVHQYDAAPMPGPASPNGGIALGGAAFWVLKDKPDKVRQGAWEFLKFAATPEQQGRWHADTGYFPSRVSAYDQPPAQQAAADFPQFQIAVNQLRASPDAPATSGALVGPFSSVRQTVTRAFETMLAGAASPADALDTAQDDATKFLKEYNRTAPE